MALVPGRHLPSLGVIWKTYWVAHKVLHTLRVHRICFQYVHGPQFVMYIRSAMYVFIRNVVTYSTYSVLDIIYSQCHVSIAY